MAIDGKLFMRHATTFHRQRLQCFAVAIAALLASGAIGASADEPKPIKQLADGRVFLTARDATVHGKKLRYESLKDTLGYWFDAGDWVSWNFEITKPGKFLVDLRQSCGPDSAGSHYIVQVGNQKLKDKVQQTGSFREFRDRRIGTLEFDKPGTYTLSIHVLDKPQLAVMDLKMVTLTPPDFGRAPPAPVPKKPTSVTTPGQAKKD